MIKIENVPEYIRKSNMNTRGSFTAEDWKLYFEYNKAVRYTDEYEARQDNDRAYREMGL